MNGWVEMWENLAWLRRHYDTSWGSGRYERLGWDVRKPCLIKKALRHSWPKVKGLKFGSSKVRKPCLIKKVLRHECERQHTKHKYYVRKPCLIKKALRPVYIWIVIINFLVRKPCLIKKALRLLNKRTQILRKPSLWENLAWLRRHYDLAKIGSQNNFFTKRSEKTLPD